MYKFRTKLWAIGLRAILLSMLTTAVIAQTSNQAPDRKEGEGPHERLIIRGANMIDGTGAPMVGPVDIVIEGNKIASIHRVGYPGVPINEDRRPKGATQELDATGMYIMPGFVDMHTHTGGRNTVPNVEYTYKLWLGHGVTTVRGVTFGGFEFSKNEKLRSEKNEIAAPRMFNYQRIGSGWDKRPETPDQVREWVRWAKKQGVDGFKLTAHDPAIMEALLDEARKQKLNSTAHLDQLGVVRMNTVDATKLGLGTQTHHYGLFESMYDGYHLQPYPSNYNYQNEGDRFAHIARQWNKVVEPGSERWNNLIDFYLEYDLTMDPTFNIYEASRDVMRDRNAEWHEEYTLPTVWEFFKPNRIAHGSYWFDWTTEDEIEWKKFYQIWMQFINDYKNAGGRVTTGSDSGFIYKLYGFGYIRELEMLQEAGFHPLEVIRSATMYGAEELYKLLDEEPPFGIIRAGKLADLVIVEENPLHNLKVLYGTGAVKVNENNEVVRVGGVKYTIKDGIVYDAKQLLKDVRDMVTEQEAEMGKKERY
ncbi:MAG: amidohydrolase family protein [Balneolaceae bacterium]